MQVGVCEDDIRGSFRLGRWTVGGDSTSSGKPLPIASTTHKQSSKKNLIRENVHKVKQTFGITVQKCYSHTWYDKAGENRMLSCCNECCRCVAYLFVRVTIITSLMLFTFPFSHVIVVYCLSIYTLVNLPLSICPVLNFNLFLILLLYTVYPINTHTSLTVNYTH